MNVINEGVEPSHFQALLQNLLYLPLYQEQGIQPIRMQKGYVEFTISGSKTVHNAAGDIHGGVQLTCGDTAMGTAVRTLGIRTATIQLNSNFLFPCPVNAAILCTGKIVESGKDFFFCQSEIRADGKVVSTFDGVFANLGPENIHPLPWVKVQTELVPISEKEGEDTCQQK